VIDDLYIFYFYLCRGICNLNNLDEERTHRINVELEDGTGVIVLFVTITVTTVPQETINETENSSQVPLEFIPSKLTSEDFERYVCLNLLFNI